MTTYTDRNERMIASTDRRRNVETAITLQAMKDQLEKLAAQAGPQEQRQHQYSARALALEYYIGVCDPKRDTPTPAAAVVERHRRTIVGWLTQFAGIVNPETAKTAAIRSEALQHALNQ